MEYDRFKVAPKVLSKSDTTLLDDEELHATVDGQLLKHLVGEVSEVDLDEATLRSVYDLKALGQKSRHLLLKRILLLVIRQCVQNLKWCLNEWHVQE
jgi:hypothetical protein